MRLPRTGGATQCWQQRQAEPMIKERLFNFDSRVDSAACQCSNTITGGLCENGLEHVNNNAGCNASRTLPESKTAPKATRPVVGVNMVMPARLKRAAIWPRSATAMPVAQGPHAMLHTLRPAACEAAACSSSAALAAA